MMKTSAAGRSTLMVREGVVLKAYQDTVGVWTIGVGHTGRATPPVVKPGMVITRVGADIMLTADLVPFEAAVNGAIKLPATQNQFDAMVSLAFNIGAKGFTGSSVVHRFNLDDVMGAADAFLMWDKPAELRQRRNGERAQFLTPDAIHDTEIPVAPVEPVHPAVIPQNPPPQTWGEWWRSIF